MASQSEIAHKLGVNLSTFKDYVAKGIIKDRPRGEYTYEECAREYLAHLREIAAGRMSSEGLVLQDERARLAKEQADAKEMENMIERGELVYIDKIVSQFERQLLRCKTKLLALPTKVAAEVHASASVKEAKEILDLAMEEALSELVGYNKDDEHEEAEAET